MAKRKPAAPRVGMAVVKTATTDADFAAVDAEIAFEVEARKSTDWLRAWRDALAADYGPNAAATDDPAELGKQNIFYHANKILSDGFAERPFPEIVRTCFQLGRQFAQVELQEMFSPMVADARPLLDGRSKGLKNSSANKTKADDSQREWVKKMVAEKMAANCGQNASVDYAIRKLEATYGIKIGRTTAMRYAGLVQQ
jgi:hypothetical protein